MAELLATFRTPQSELMQVADVQQVEAQLEVVLLAARRSAKSWRIRRSMLLYHGIDRAEALGDLAAVRAQILVLLDERVERGPLLVRRDVRAAVTVARWIELDLTLVARDVDQIVPALAVTVHVAGVDERVAVAAGAGEAVALGHLDEHADLRPRRGDHVFEYVAPPTMRCRWPNSEKLSSGLFGSPCTGWFCHSTLAISVDLRLFFASV